MGRNLPILFAGFFLSVGILTGCASSHNFNAQGWSALGGGFAEEQVLPGLYRMTAKSNMSLWPSFSAAESTWKARADALCGKDAYQSFEISADEGRRANVTTATVVSNYVVAAGLLRYNASISGYLLCRSSGMTIAQASSYLKEEHLKEEKKAAQERRAELAQLGGENCAADEKNTGEIFYRRGKALMALQDYSAAQQCFVRSQEVEKSGTYFTEACYMLGMMYESGMGVGKDMDEAKSWYARAGL